VPRNLYKNLHIAILPLFVAVALLSTVIVRIGRERMNKTIMAYAIKAIIALVVAGFALDVTFMIISEYHPILCHHPHIFKP